MIGIDEHGRSDSRARPTAPQWWTTDPPAGRSDLPVHERLRRSLRPGKPSDIAWPLAVLAGGLFVAYSASDWLSTLMGPAAPIALLAIWLGWSWAMLGSLPSGLWSPGEPRRRP